jgi:N-dimethylarginine dimethylaminohydrolase
VIPLSGEGDYTYGDMHKVFKAAGFRSEKEFMDWWRTLSKEDKAEMFELSK